MTDTTDTDGTTEGTFTAEQMAEVRNEAKSWRLKLREAEAERDAIQAKVAELTTQNESLSSELDGIKSAQERAALVSRIADEAGVPADVLRGDTEEELTAHAELLKPVFDKAQGAHVPNIGDVPEKPANELAAFASELFGSNE